LSWTATRGAKEAFGLLAQVMKLFEKDCRSIVESEASERLNLWDQATVMLADQLYWILTLNECESAN